MSADDDVEDPRARARAARVLAREAVAQQRLDAYVRRVVAAAPPLTDAQRTEIALLLRRH